MQAAILRRGVVVAVRVLQDLAKEGSFNRRGHDPHAFLETRKEARGRFGRALALSLKQRPELQARLSLSGLPRLQAGLRRALHQKKAQTLVSLKGGIEIPVLCGPPGMPPRSEEHTSELQSRLHLVCRLLLEKKKKSHLPRQP